MTARYSCYCGVCPTCKHRAYVARNREKVQANKTTNQRAHREARKGVMFDLADAERLPMNAWVQLTEDQVWHVVNQYLEEATQ